MAVAVDWKRELPKVLVPAAVGVGYALWRGGSALGSARFWGILALLLVPEIVTGLASAHLRQTGKPRAAFLLKWSGMVWLLGGVALLSMRGQAVKLTTAERAAFVAVEEGGQRRLRHPALGFSFLDPGPGFEADRSIAYRPDAHFYAFVDRDQVVALYVGLFKGQGDSPSSRISTWRSTTAGTIA